MLNKTICYMSYLVLFSILGLDVFLLYKYAYDVPFWDTWDLLPNGSYSHLFDFYNENMQFFYFIISEIVYKTLNWNLRYFNFVCFGVYLIIIFIYWKILKYADVDKKICFYPLCLSVLLTPMLGHNWLWVLLVQTHTFILFFLLAIYLGFIKDSSKYSPYLFSISLFLSVISMNIPLAIGALLAYIIKEFINAGNKITIYVLKKYSIVFGVLLILFVILSFLTTPLRFIEVKMSNAVIDYDYIKHLSFYIVNCLSVFSLAKILGEKVCLIWFVIHFVILATVFFEQYKNKRIQPLWAILFGVLFCVCGVVAFRGAEVYFYDKSYIRHNETAFIMLPATLMILMLSKYKISKFYGITLLCLMLYGITADIKAKRFQFFGELFYKNGCVCLNHYWNLKTIDKWHCTMNFPIPHGTGYAKGKELNLSFIETIKKCR